MIENTFGVHTSSSDYPRSHIDRLLSISTLVKVCHQWNDSQTLHQWRDKAPQAWFLGRDIQRDLEGHELHNNYSRLKTQNDAYTLGAWWATTLADAVIRHSLQWMYWEGGPNEHNDPVLSASFSLGFVHSFLSHGCKPAPGSWAYGQPKTPPWNTEDEWLPWQPVFQAIDAANRDSNGQPLEKPRAIYQLHQYAKDKSLVDNAEATTLRHRTIWNRNVLPYRYWVPLAISEDGYAQDGANDGRPPAREMYQQILRYNAELAKDPYVIGYAWYDWRGATSGTPDDYMNCADALINTIAAQGYTPRQIVPPGGIIPVPPEPEPDPPDGMVPAVNSHPGRTRVRSGPGLMYEIVGHIGQGETAQISQEAALNLGDDQSWCDVKLGELEGWSAAWCLEKG